MSTLFKGDLVRVWRVVGPKPNRAWDFIVNYPSEKAARRRAEQLGPGHKVGFTAMRKEESEDVIWVPEETRDTGAAPDRGTDVEAARRGGAGLPERKYGPGFDSRGGA